MQNTRIYSLEDNAGGGMNGSADITREGYANEKRF
jgi:hypothetical protein